MTLADVVKELNQLKREVGDLREQLEYQRAVEGIRRGFDSANRGEGESVQRAFDRLRRKHKSARRRR